ncbi:transglycosylase family protein [Lysobacter antibioticus]|uniref:transglycosylase domain-containing protein n=1 Tax=Lysobacter antibioticus TaxID=84531 RepID=UPI0007173CE6|nr:transglycosylase domain-containing protein [Lysobacter antibioticus]ALN65363.1 transglycosylase family protein [Lysobacter antibioticus]
MEVLIKWLLGGAFALVAALCLLLQGVYWYGARDLPGQLPGPSRQYPDSTRTLLWNQFGGRGEISVRKFNAISYPVTALAFGARYFLNPSEELQNPADLQLLDIASNYTGDLIERQAEPPLPHIVHDSSMGSNVEALSQPSYDRHFQSLALPIRLSREWPATRMLDMVLEHADYGRGTTGLDEAAQAYFGAPAENLSQAETVALLSLKFSPGYIDPYCDAADFRTRFAIALAKSDPTAIDGDPMRQLTRLKPIACKSPN